jgi:PIN domain nuclease of toxin-antitoxin system
LSETARATIIAAERVLVSAISAYEISLKFSLGRLASAELLLTDGIAAYVDAQDFETLPVAVHHAERAGSLPLGHRDPWDRILAAQALAEDLAIISIDDKLDQFGIRRLW